MPTTHQVTRRDRWVALGVLVLVLGAAYLVFVHPLWTVPLRDANEQIALLQQRELRARMLAQQAPEVDERLQDIRSRKATSPWLIPEPTPERATSWMVQHLEAVVAEASPGNRSCAITSRTPLPSGSKERFPEVTVLVRMQCGIAELAQVLHALEDGHPALFVENLRIVAHPRSSAGADMAGGLDASFELHGHVAPSAGEAADET